jgi:tetratricopeptide (TPR) repeat protein
MQTIRYFTLAIVLFLGACASQQQEAPNGAEKAEVDPMLEQFEHGILLMHQGKLEQAKKIMLAIHEHAPRLTGPMLNLALIHIRLGDKGSAADWLDKVLKLIPHHPVALTYSGLMAREEGMFALAEARYREALAGAPEYEPAILNLAILLDRYRGRLPEALALYERYQAMQRQPDPKVKDWIIDLRRRLGEQ